MNLLTAFKEQQISEDYFQASDQELLARIQVAKDKLGERLLMVAHHYQKDEVVQFADFTGDSLQLAQLAAKNKTAEYIVFCGVHFMAETADMLTEADQKVILPDLSAGCSMADMANRAQLEQAWGALQDRYPNEIIPITYVNSSAGVKAFVGEQNGAIVTSSNAAEILAWAFTQKKRVFFLPDQHLGRNTAYNMGIPLDNMVNWDPINQQALGDLHDEVKVILWHGWCSVHQQFTTKQIAQLRSEYPELKVIVHPECPQEIVSAADEYGSTQKIIQVVKNSPKSSQWAIGTDHNLVNRMKQELTDHEIFFINPIACACLTMNRIKLPHLAWTLEQLVQGEVVNQITVDPDTTHSALKALNQMLILS